MKGIYWRVFVSSKNDKPKTFVKNFFTKSYPNISIQKDELYWKDKSLHELQFLHEFSEDTNNDKLITKVFSQIELVSNQWDISFSTNETGSIEELSGLISKEIPKLKIQWIHFSLEDITK